MSLKTILWIIPVEDIMLIFDWSVDYRIVIILLLYKYFTEQIIDRNITLKKNMN